MKNISVIERKFVCSIVRIYKQFRRCSDHHPYAFLFLSACGFATTVYAVKAEWDLAQSYACGIFYFASIVGVLWGLIASIKRLLEVSDELCKK